MTKKVAILSTDGFEESELNAPQAALIDAGYSVSIIAPIDDPQDGEHYTIKSWRDGDWGTDFAVDLPLSKADPDDFDALVLPGGVINPDKIRINTEAIEFIQAIAKENKPIAAICHGPWSLINAELVAGKRMTSYQSIQQDLVNAGADWEDSSVVVDGGLITSRYPDDLDDFNQAIIAAL